MHSGGPKAGETAARALSVGRCAPGVIGNCRNRRSGSSSSAWSGRSGVRRDGSRFSTSSMTRALFERNLALKLRSAQFAADIGPLLAADHAWDMKEAAEAVGKQLLTLLPGEPWRSEEDAG